MKEQTRNKISTILLLVGIVFMFLSVKNGIEESITSIFIDVFKYNRIWQYVTFFKYIPQIIGVFISIAYLVIKKTELNKKISAFIFLSICFVIGCTLFGINFLKNFFLDSQEGFWMLKIIYFSNYVFELLLLIFTYIYLNIILNIEEAQRKVKVFMGILAILLFISSFVKMFTFMSGQTNIIKILPFSLGDIIYTLFIRLENYIDIFVLVTVIVKVYKTFISENTNKKIGILYYLPFAYIYLLKVIYYIFIVCLIILYLIIK